MVIRAYKAIICNDKRTELCNFISECESKIRRDYFDAKKIMNVNAFATDKELYIYIESCEDEISPSELFLGIEKYLCIWPDTNNAFYQLTEIFHFNAPQNIDHWTRKEKPKYCFCMLAKIVPELASRYIYYHYQFQEERPGSGDKYGRIFFMGDTALYYGEYPDVFEMAQHKGALTTNNTPDGDEWQNIMGTHFRWWDDSYPAIDSGTYDWDCEGYPSNRTNNQWLYIENLLSIV